MKDIETQIDQDLEPILKSMGISLVELNVALVKKVHNIRLVIYKDSGITMQDCEEVHKVIKPRLDLLLESRDSSMEITSPGIDRKIKREKEYLIFKGKGVRILTESDSEWVSGIISDVLEGCLVLEKEGETLSIPLSSIRKAKLDYTMEAN